jgi:hypothetical protein
MTLAAAIRVACSLGFCRINLVGCDWSMDTANPYAFKDSRPPAIAEKNNRYYELWSRRFREIRQILDRAGVEVRNATPGSLLKAFDPITLDQAIADALERFGIDTATERTDGMYGHKPPQPRKDHHAQRSERIRARRDQRVQAIQRLRDRNRVA